MDHRPVYLSRAQQQPTNRCAALDWVAETNVLTPTNFNEQKQNKTKSMLTGEKFKMKQQQKHLRKTGRTFCFEITDLGLCREAWAERWSRVTSPTVGLTLNQPVKQTQTLFLRNSLVVGKKKAP